MKSSTDGGELGRRPPHLHLLHVLWTRTKSYVLDRIVGAAIPALLTVGCAAFVFIWKVWVPPSEWLANERRERIEAYRTQAEDELWAAKNMTFEGPFSEQLALLFRRDRLDQAVLLELRARRLEDGRLVKRARPAEWSEDVFSYPMDLVLPLDMEYPPPSTP